MRTTSGCRWSGNCERGLQAQRRGKQCRNGYPWKKFHSHYGKQSKDQTDFGDAALLGGTNIILYDEKRTLRVTSLTLKGLRN